MFDNIKDWAVRFVKSRLFVLVVLFSILTIVLIQRVFVLQIVNGQDYLDNYKLQIKKEVEITGTRGNIYDRNGELLAYNELAYSVTIEDNGEYETVKEKNKTLNKTMDQVISIVESNDDIILNEFGVILDSNNEYVYVAEEGARRLRFLADIYGYRTVDELSTKQRNITAKELIHYLCTDKTVGYGISVKELENKEVLKRVNIRYAMSLNRYQKYVPTKIAFAVSQQTVVTIMEHLDELQGVNVLEESIRKYTDGQYFSSLLGYTGKISQDEFDKYEEEGKKYDLTDVIGKAGLEQTMDEMLQGEKGEASVYVDSIGKVIETEKLTDPKAGNDLYLTIDKNLQKAVYNIIEQKLAGIIVSKMQNVMNYNPASAGSSGKIVIPADDVYHSFFANNILDINHFSSPDAKTAEKYTLSLFQGKQEGMTAELMSNLTNPSAGAYKDISKELQVYQDYIVQDLLTTKSGILLKENVDSSDATYKAWTEEKSINIYTYLNYAISKNWVDTSKLKEYTPEEGKYTDATELYQSLLTFINTELLRDKGYSVLLYQYLIKSGTLSGTQVCLMLYEQGILAFDEAAYNGLAAGGIGPYEFIRGKIQNLEITPAQLALEPATGSAVVTDVNTGKTLACVSYPGYDNNRLANTMDAPYYNKLVTDRSRPLFNSATQEKTAPGSTYKMVSSIAGLTEGLINGGSRISCEGVYTKVSPNPKCWIYPGAHGSLNVVEALDHSCNSFYYELGFRLGLKPDDNGNSNTYSSDLGIQKLDEYAAMLGLDSASGLEIPEAEPQISDSYSVPSAIGQGTNNYTTSQLARYVATVANGGTVYNLSLLDKVTDLKGNVIETYEPTVHSTADKVSENSWNLVQQGMKSMVRSSRTFSDLRTLNFSMAGKTGTAQQSKIHPDHALFVGYAPSDAPEIAISVRIANGYSSAYAAEIGQDIVKFKYELVDRESLLTGSASEVAAVTVGD